MDALRAYIGTLGPKTAIMIVQEICQKEGCHTPRYGERDLKKTISDRPMFEVTATVIFRDREYTSSGQAPNKKEAKQEASLNLLNAMGITPKDLVETYGHKARTPFGVASKENEMLDGAMGTPAAPKPDLVMGTVGIQLEPPVTSGQAIQELILLCEKRNMPQPEYEEVGDEGPPHLKTFHIRCRVKPLGNEPIDVVGSANQKKKAKNVAASMMLGKLQDVSGAHGNFESLAHIVASKSGGFFTSGPTVICRDKGRCSELFCHSHHRYQKLLGQEIMKLRDIDLSDTMNEVVQNPMQFLVKIAEDEKLGYEYVSVNEPGNNGLWQTHLEIRYPDKIGGEMSVFMGEGETMEFARRFTALAALHFLKEVSTP